MGHSVAQRLPRRCVLRKFKYVTLSGRATATVAEQWLFLTESWTLPCGCVTGVIHIIESALTRVSSAYWQTGAQLASLES